MPITKEMKKIFRKTITGLSLSLAIFSHAFADNETLVSKSRIDWIKKIFTSSITLDVEKDGIPLPSGKNTARNKINTRLVNLIKDPLLTLNVDSSRQLGDCILENDITLRDVAQVVETSTRTPGFFDNETSLFKVNNTIDVNELGSLFVRHNSPYERKKSIEIISSRAYTGIIIDARGLLPVHGEFIKSKVHASLFPKVWNEEMEAVYERSMVQSSTARENGICRYDYSDDETRYRDIAGDDPLRILAQKTFGQNRTDLVISNDDALRIFTIPENTELLKQGKVVILLDKDELVYDVSAPVKESDYYATVRTIKTYPPRFPGAEKIESGPDGLKLYYNLNFIADSPELLPTELPRIVELAELLKSVLKEDVYTIFVAGHTADIGQPENQMNLSIERTQTIISALIEEGLPSNLFSYRGYGGTDPVATNATPEGRAENRRVVITIRPKATYIQRMN